MIFVQQTYNLKVSLKSHDYCKLFYRNTLQIKNKCVILHLNFG